MRRIEALGQQIGHFFETLAAGKKPHEQSLPPPLMYKGSPVTIDTYSNMEDVPLQLVVM